MTQDDLLWDRVKATADWMRRKAKDRLRQPAKLPSEMSEDELVDLASNFGTPMGTIRNVVGRSARGALGTVARDGAKAATPTRIAAANATPAGATPPIRAWHGSPYDFDRFDISKIGTGEGQQVEGWGLYFGGNEKTGRYYRDALSKLERPAFAKPSDARRIPGGRIYEVGIHSTPAELLDKDLPLMDQPEVLARLRQAGLVLPDAPSFKVRAIPEPGMLPVWGGDGVTATGAEGHHLYQRLVAAAKRQQGGTRALHQIAKDVGSPEVAASRFLLDEAGIPGLQYFDQFSRTPTLAERTRNYVMFNDDKLSILQKLALAGMIGGGAAAARQPTERRGKQPLGL